MNVTPQVPPRPDLGTRALPGAAGVQPDSTLPQGWLAVTWRWWHALLAYLVTNLVIAQGLVGGTLVAITGIDIVEGAADGSVLGLTLVTNAVWVTGLVLWLRRAHPGWRDAIRLVPATRRFREFGVSFAIGLGLYPVVAIGAALIVGLLLQIVTNRTVAVPQQIESDLSVAGQVAALGVALVAAPIAEELFFRGVLFRSIRDRHGFWPGALSSSLLFGLGHYVAAPWADAVFLQGVMVVTGVGLCLVYEWRKSLLSSIAAHVAFNAVGIVIILVTG
jgi:uncharacterized protein